MDDLDRLLQTLYRVPLNPEGWKDALPALARAVRTVNAHLMVWDPQLPTPRYSHAHGIDPDMERDYRAHYGNIDPRRLQVQRLSPGHWYACQQHFDEKSVQRNEFYQDYLIPGNCRWLLGTKLLAMPGSDVYLGLHRACTQRSFSDAERSLVARLTPHLQTAVELWLSAQVLRRQARLGLQALDAMETGVIACSAAGHTVYANRLAESMLRSGWPLGQRHGWLQLHTLAAVGGNLGAGVAFSSALGACALSRRPQQLRCGQPNHPDQPLCTITVLPLADEHLLHATVPTAECLVLLAHASHRRQASVTQLMQLFSLTAAEARLARALTTGQSLDASAQALGIARTTARTQLASVFRKLGVHTQTDLVRLLQLLPAVR